MIYFYNILIHTDTVTQYVRDPLSHLHESAIYWSADLRFEAQHMGLAANNHLNLIIQNNS